MKIVRLQSSNVKRLRAVEIRPDGSLVIVGGKNGQGKSSLLQSIEYALGGKRAIPAEPIRRGETEAEIIVELDDLIVRRRFTPSNTYLEVTTKDGVPQRSPQALLDRLVGELTFDPLAFSRQDPRTQLNTLKTLVGLDFSDLDAKREKVYHARTAMNRELASLKAKLDATPYHPDAPEGDVSVAELAKELERRRDTNDANQKKRYALGDARQEATDLRDKIEKLEEKLAGLRADLEARIQKGKVLAAEVAELQDEDEQEIRDRIAGAEKTNRKVRENYTHAGLESERASLQTEADQLTKTIAEIDAAKEKAVAGASMPIAELGLSDNGVTLNGLPLEQAASSEQLQVSVAIGLALHRDLRVLLIRDGSLLDEDSLRLVAEMAEAAEAQVWIETVSTGKECSVILEDGAVKAREEVAA